MRLLTAVSGVRVPQQAPQSTPNGVLFVLIKRLGPQHLRCTALPLTLLLAVDAHKFANTRWQSPSTGAIKHSKRSAFLLSYNNNGPPVAMPLCYAYDTAEPHWALRSVCKHTHSAICRWPSPRAGAIKHSKQSAFCLLTYSRNLLIQSVIIIALTMSEDGTRGAAATRKGAPSTRICTQSLVRSVFFAPKRQVA